MSKRRRRLSAIRILLIASAAVVLIFLGVLPLVEMYLQANGASLDGIPGYEILEAVRTSLMKGLIIAWFFALGSMVGSFANVVVYRMPRGMSIVASPSACPYCRSKIRLSDNLPVFGWLKLGGRCRVCRLPISPRYPIVELIFGLIFVLLFFVELTSGGGNLPGGDRTIRHVGILSLFLETPWTSIGLYAFHCTLLSVLLIWALIAYDGNRIPVKTIVFALLVGFLAPATAPLQPVKWTFDQESWFADLTMIQLVDTQFIGLSIGFVIGGILDWVFVSNQRTTLQSENRSPHLAIGLMTTGLFLGWQAAVTVTALFSLIWIIAIIYQNIARARLAWITPLACLTVATVVQICGWRWIAEPVPMSANWMHGAMLGAISIISLAIVWLSLQVKFKLHKTNETDE